VVGLHRSGGGTGYSRNNWCHHDHSGLLTEKIVSWTM
jgi:hypothetical protein